MYGLFNILKESAVHRNTVIRNKSLHPIFGSDMGVIYEK